MKEYKNPLSIRGDCLYCPLPFSLDAYTWCDPNCIVCYLRGLNHIWGTEQRAANPENVARKLTNGLKNKNPASPLAWAIKNKNAIRFGNKADPFQPIEEKLRVSQELLHVLVDLDWEFVIQTHFAFLPLEYEDIIFRNKDKITYMPVISPGYLEDWENLERMKTDSPVVRLRVASSWKKKGLKVGINGEPFIPGYHTVEQFEDTVKAIKDKGINRYNTYNFHFTPFVAKRMAEAGIDVMVIWENNRDEKWRPILQQLIDIAKKHDIILGCPDFVNSGSYHQSCNTCCGLDVDNPTSYNTHNWKRLLKEGKTIEQILEETWDGVGDREEGEKILKGKSSKFYTMADVVEDKPKRRFKIESRRNDYR